MNVVNECDASDCDDRLSEALKAEYRPHSLFTFAGVLFNHVVYICVCPHCEICWQDLFFLQRCHRCMGGGIPGQGNLLRDPSLRDRSHKEALGRGGAELRAEGLAPWLTPPALPLSPQTGPAAYNTVPA